MESWKRKRKGDWWKREKTCRAILPPFSYSVSEIICFCLFILMARNPSLVCMTWARSTLATNVSGPAASSVKQDVERNNRPFLSKVEIYFVKAYIIIIMFMFARASLLLLLLRATLAIMNLLPLSFFFGYSSSEGDEPSSSSDTSTPWVLFFLYSPVDRIMAHTRLPPSYVAHAFSFLFCRLEK